MVKNKYKIYVNICQIMQNQKPFLHSNDIINSLNNRGEKLTSSIINLYTRLSRLRLPGCRLKSGMLHRATMPIFGHALNR